MATKAGTATKYDVNEYKQKIEQALAKLKEQKPGEAAGKAGKNEILGMFKKEIIALAREGYTSQQIANAIKSDVFGILPKTITELISNETKTRAKKSRNDSNDDANTRTAKLLKQEHNKASNKANNATFAIQPDEEV